jgi:hypothetical protein
MYLVKRAAAAWAAGKLDVIRGLLVNARQQRPEAVIE